MTGALTGETMGSVVKEETAPKEDCEAQRDAILEAAMVCLREFGYERMTLEDIATQAKLPWRVVTAHFPSKADIMKGLYSLWSERLSAWIVYA